MQKLQTQRAALLLVSVIMTLALTARSQETADGREHPLQDKFLDGLFLFGLRLG
jgi:hypothetical protein